MSRASLNIGILGTGNIGTDLMVKALRSPVLNCTIFAGRNLNSAGMKKASALGVAISDRGIASIEENPGLCDLVFDATSAAAHQEHWKILDRLGKHVIDLTPANIGRMCAPAINVDECSGPGVRNVNMITCGGQSSIPIAYAVAGALRDVDYVEVASSIASRSAGPATRLNLDEYVETTEMALRKFVGVQKAKAILILNPAHPPIDMQTTIYVHARSYDVDAARQAVEPMVGRLKRYVPGFDLIVPPTLEGGRLITTIKVRGNGDYLPQYAGNLDIINCAAIAVAEAIAEHGGSALGLR